MENHNKKPEDLNLIWWNFEFPPALSLARGVPKDRMLTAKELEIDNLDIKPRLALVESNIKEHSLETPPGTVTVFTSCTCVNHSKGKHKSNWKPKQ